MSLPGHAMLTGPLTAILCVRVPPYCPTALRQPAWGDTHWSRARGALAISPGAEAAHQPGVSTFPWLGSPVTLKVTGCVRQKRPGVCFPSVKCHRQQ